MNKKVVLIVVIIFILGGISYSFSTSPSCATRSEIKQTSITRNVPPIPGASLCIKVIGSFGFPVKKGTVEVSVEFPGERSYYNYQYTIDLASLKDGLIYLSPPPSHEPATVLIKVIALNGRASDTLAILNNQYWEAVESTKSNFVARHTFKISSDGQISKVSYIK